MGRSGVSFYGIDQVCEAYENNDVAPWAILCGKELMFSCSEQGMEVASNELRETIKLIQKGGSDAIFILRVYKLKPGEEIMSTTPYFRSFTFKTFERDENTFLTRPYRQAEDERLQRIEEAIEELRDLKASGPQEMGGIGAVLLPIFQPILTNPEFQKAVALRAIGLVDNIFPMKGREQPGQVAGTDVPNGNTGSVLNQDQVTKVQQAINILAAHDPQLGDNLLKVAKLAKENPGRYQSALQWL